MKVVVLISGRGSNLAALFEAMLPVDIAAVISHRADARGLDIAVAHRVPGIVVAHRAHATREAFETALAAAIDTHAPALVVLAGRPRPSRRQLSATAPRRR